MNWFAKMVHSMYDDREKRNNRGMTLVELVCAVAIFSLVATAAGGVLVVSARNYTRGTTEAELQQAAQLAVNQIEDLIIDAVAAPGSSTHLLRIEKDSVLYEVYQDSANRQLLYREYTVTPTGVIPASESQLLADNVDVFNVDISQYSTNGNVLLHLELSNQDRSYAADFTITSRNGRNVTGNSAFAASISTVSELVLEPNEDYEVAVNVEGNLMSNAVEWTKSDNSTSAATAVTPTEDGKYKIHIGTDETAGEVMFTVATQEKNGLTPYAFTTITVHVRRVNSVSITAAHTGSNYTLTANVEGSNLASLTGVPKDGGAGADSGYVSPYDIKWEYFLTDYAGTQKGDAKALGKVTNVVESGLETMFDVSLGDDENLLVRVTALHPDGHNRTSTDYGDVYGEWTLLTMIKGGGVWKRNGRSPLLAEDLPDEYLTNNGSGDDYFIKGDYGGHIDFNVYRNGGLNYWMDRWATYGDQGGFGMFQDQNLGLRLQFTYGDPRRVDMYLDYYHQLVSFSSPYFIGNLNPQTNYGVGKIKLEMVMGGSIVAVGLFDIEDVIIQYRNSESENWSSANGNKQIIYVTPEDAKDIYTTYFTLAGGWNAEGGFNAAGNWDPSIVCDPRLCNRFVGVVQDAPGYANDRGYDLSFVRTSDGTVFRNNMSSEGHRVFGTWAGSTLNMDIISSKEADGNSTISVQISQAEKEVLCARGEVIQEIYEYNPWFTNTDPGYWESGLTDAGLYAPTVSGWHGEYPITMNPNDGLSDSERNVVEQIDGCDGILEYHFVQANVVLSDGRKLDCMYCPDASGTCYYMNNTSRYNITGAASAAYQELQGGSWVTVYNLTKGADGIWRN